MQLSARNQLPGTVEEIHLGGIMARIVVKVGENVIESVITRQSVEELGLKQGDSVQVVVKATEVMIQKAQFQHCEPAFMVRSVFYGSLGVNCRVRITLLGH
jgi:molybdopterin-binding protein